MTCPTCYGSRLKDEGWRVIPCPQCCPDETIKPLGPLGRIHHCAGACGDDNDRFQGVNDEHRIHED